jgi:hypothetical protein
MTARLTLTVEGDTLADIYAALELELARIRGNVAPSSSVSAILTPPVDRPVGASCPNGHGAMRLIPGGTAKSGPRIGQPYPAFLKCDVCGTRREVEG